MNAQVLQRAVELARTTRQVLVATSDSHGLPHLSVAQRLALRGEDTVSLFGWSCPVMISNLAANARISLVIWDMHSDRGYQLLGEVRAVREHSILDGYLPRQGPDLVPQVEHELQVSVEQVLRFSHFPHTDQPEAT